MIYELLHFFGRAICHQIEDRTLLASGKSLSVCARDTGIYLGIFSSLSYLHLVKRKLSITIPSVKVSFFLLLFMIPLMIDGLGSYTHLFESNNVRRLITGICFGFVLPYFVYPLVLGKSLERESVPVIQKRWDFIVPILLSCTLGGLVYLGWLPYVILDSFIILIMVVWFSLLVSFLFSSFRRYLVRGSLSICGSLVFLSILSFIHQLLIPL